MSKLNFGPAKKFLYTCQYLKGQEIKVKRRNGRVSDCTIIGFGAVGTVYTKIHIWAKVKDTSSGKEFQVDLMKLYKMYPPSYFAKKNGVAAPAPVEAIAEESAAAN